MVVLRDGMCPGLSEELVVALRAADITTGADLYEDLLSSTAILSTGNPSLDKLLDSGLYTGELTELAGGPGSGKTQVCFGVAVNISYQLKQSVIYIDSTGGLSASRLLQMLQAKLCNMEEQASAGGGSVKAVIVDSVSAVISPILGGKQNEGMSMMMQVAGLLKTIAKDFNVAVLVTNTVTRDGNGQLKAGLGQSWSHVPRIRILLQRFERPGSTCSSLRTATLAKSSRQPCHLKEEFDLQCWGRSEDQLYGASAEEAGQH
ncbi:unnamed protein product [Coregonus sp. 'balchen']|nr:unnamed protein product [Coregonus sp. 'balchen']